MAERRHGQSGVDIGVQRVVGNRLQPAAQVCSVM
jgi:hypothetical protein